MSIKKRVAVIFGGQSTEHEVSLASATTVLRNINRDKWDVLPIGITKEGEWLLYEGDISKISTGEWANIAREDAKVRKIDCWHHNTIRNIFCAIGAQTKDKPIDVIFPMVHGNNCEDGVLQGVLKLSGIPYVGPNVLSSAVCMDKVFAKIMFESAGIPTCKYLSYMRDEVDKNKNKVILEIEEKLGYPCFVKPANAGSSVGVSKVYARDKLMDALILAGEYDRKILVEEFIDAREIECAVLGNDDPKASVLGEAITGGDFYDYDFKYKSSESKTIIPADLDDKISEKIREYAVKAFLTLNCEVMSRVDFFVCNKTGRILLNEINTLPGFTDISMYPKLWESTGISCSRLIDKLIEFAVDRSRRCVTKMTQ